MDFKKILKKSTTTIALGAVIFTGIGGSVFADGIEVRNNIPFRNYSGKTLSQHSPEVYLSGTHTLSTGSGKEGWSIKLKKVVSMQPDPYVALVTNKTNPGVTKNLSSGQYYIEYEGYSNNSAVRAGTHH